MSLSNVKCKRCVNKVDESCLILLREKEFLEMEGRYHGESTGIRLETNHDCIDFVDKRSKVK
jgi:hypothetical protein